MNIINMLLAQPKEGILNTISIESLLGKSVAKDLIKKENAVCKAVGFDVFDHFESINSQYQTAINEKMYKLGVQYGYKVFMQHLVIGQAINIPGDDELADTYYNSKEATAPVEYEDELETAIKDIKDKCGYDLCNEYDSLNNTYHLEDGRVHYIQGVKDAINLLTEMSGKNNK